VNEFPARMAHVVTTEVALEAALHVPASQAHACLQQYGVDADSLQMAPSLVSHSSDHLLDDSVPDMHLAACLATPVEGTTIESSAKQQNPLRAAGAGSTMIARTAGQKLSGAHEAVSIMDRYGDWIRRLHRRKSMESLQAMLAETEDEHLGRPHKDVPTNPIPDTPLLTSEPSLRINVGSLSAVSFGALAVGASKGLEPQPSFKFDVADSLAESLEAVQRRLRRLSSHN